MAETPPIGGAGPAPRPGATRSRGARNGFAFIGVTNSSRQCVSAAAEVTG
ncbi:hypothetical protein [Thermocatellispora tengchongensis]